MKSFTLFLHPGDTFRKRLAIPLMGLAFLLLAFGNDQCLAQTIRADLGAELPGNPLKSFAPAVGVWSSVKDGDRTVLMVDGRKWTRGKPSPELAASARGLYGERSAEFERSVAGHANFPFAVFTGLADFTDGEIAFRFKSVQGKEDQAAGIIFDIKPNGEALILRANALEDNLILFQYANGRRIAVKTVDEVPTAKGVWHDLKLVVKGTKLEGFLDGKLFLEQALQKPVSGRIGVWSKDDSVMLLDDFVVTVPN